MDEAHNIRNRTFSFGAHGYDQEDVDRYLHELADRVDSADVDWHDEVERLGRQTFGVVSLGYWRPDVDSYLAELRSWMVERAGERPVTGGAPEAAAEPAADADVETRAMPSGWSQGIVERLRRVTEASTAPTALADLAHEPVPDVVSASPLRLQDSAEGETADRVADRVRLFRMAIALGVEDAVSMSVDELVAAIDRAQAGDAGADRGDGASEEVEDANAALARTKATLASFERMLADQVSQVAAAAQREREAAARDAEAVLREAERRAGEILAAAQREGEAVGERAQRYSERLRRMADREALRRAAMVAAPMAASPDQMPEPEPEVIAGADAEAEAEAEPTPEAASTWRRVRRIVRGDAAAQHTSAEE